MKKFFAMGLLMTVAMPAAEEGFSKTVRAEDFAAAGLAKLSPAELARLDALVRDYRSRALLAAGSTGSPQARHKAEAAQVEPVPPPENFLTRAKKVLVPAGAQVEVAAIESRLVGEFDGWQGKAVFTLENGQRWQMANAGSYYSPVLKNPAVKITPAALGGFWLTIEGVNQRVKVVPVGGN